MSSNKITGTIVQEYLERFPMIGAHTIAKKIYNENSAVFSDTEAVRSLVRYYLGQHGKRHRADMASSSKKFLREARGENKYDVPESDSVPWDPFHLPSHHNSGLLFSDLHYPYHGVRAVNTMIDHAVGRSRKINFIFMNGDAQDFYQASKFMKDGRNRSISNEIWGMIEFINILKHNFPGAKIYWKLGNHEERLENWLKIKAPELLDMEEFKLGNILKIRGCDDIHVIEKQIVYMGRLPVVHGHEFAGKNASTPVNPARSLALKTLSSSLCSHHHRSSSHSDLDVNEKPMSWFSLGCMCDLHPEYALLNKWNQGFGYIGIDGLDFEFENYKIYGDLVYRA